MGDNWNQNGEGYADVTAGIAVQKVASDVIRLNNRRNREVGAVFEKWLEAACVYYLERGCACIEKTPEPMRPIRPYGDRKRGQFIACYVKRAQPDFKGVLCDGTCIIFDAKHTDKDRIQQNTVTEAQWNMFDQYELMGAKCFVIVSIELEKFFRIPWNVWKKMKELYGHKYMAVGKELSDYQIPRKNCTVLFLEGVEVK